jgi:hypothetical protein
MGAIRTEIQFFMDRCFQASFGYLAALITFLAISKTGSVRSIATILHLKLDVLISIAVLLLNLFYFIVILSCLFAVLKRGYFVITRKSSSLSREWEVFERVPPPKAEGEDDIQTLAWNIDNYYMVPILALLAVLSIIAALVAVEIGSGWDLAILVPLLVLHAIPGWIGLRLWRLWRRAARAAERVAAV